MQVGKKYPSRFCVDEEITISKARVKRVIKGSG